MIERVAILVGLLLALAALYAAVVLGAQRRKASRVQRMRNPELASGRTTLLYFTGEYCTVCKYRQSPAIEQLRADVNGRLQVLELDAAREPALTKRFGVLSLPSTVVLAPDGTVNAVNYGFAPKDQLLAQVASVAG